MEPEKTDLYIQKLKESIDINRTLLTTDSETHRDLNQFNARFQSLLQEVFEQSQATFRGRICRTIAAYHAGYR